jgi:anti-sigma B factor antagonist
LDPILEQTPPFEVRTVEAADEVTVAIRGELDVSTASQLWEHLAEAIPRARHRLVLDLSDTGFIDSIGLGVFVRAFKRLRDQGSELVLRSPRRNARRILNVTGLDRVMMIDGVAASVLDPIAGTLRDAVPQSETAHHEIADES